MFIKNKQTKLPKLQTTKNHETKKPHTNQTKKPSETPTQNGL